MATAQALDTAESRRAYFEPVLRRGYEIMVSRGCSMVREEVTTLGKYRVVEIAEAPKHLTLDVILGDYDARVELLSWCVDYGDEDAE